MGTRPGGWTERHLFRVALDGRSSPVCLTADRPGVHACVVDVKSGQFVDTFSSLDAPATFFFKSIPPP